MKVILRADADATIGAGHLMRCLALGRALTTQAEVVVATSCDNDELLAHVARAGLPVTRIDRVHPDPRDARHVIDTARGGQSAVVIDGYHFDGEYVEGLRRAGVRTVMIDDGPRLPEYTCDLLLDQNLGALTQPYALDERTHALLGPRFTLLRPEFHRVARRAAGAVARSERLLVTMGASDPADATSFVLRALAPLGDGFDVTVIVGGANERVAAIEAIAKGLVRARVLRNPAGLEQLMSDSDLAVAAVGGTIWELAYLGVPTLLLSGTDVHHRVAETADRYGAHSWMGPIATTSADAIRAALLSLAGDEARRLNMSRLGQALIDGDGARRVAAAICSPSSDWTVRRATARDTEAAWEISDSVETFGAFERRFQDLLQSPATRTSVVERDEAIGGVAWTERGTGALTVAVPAALRGRERPRRLVAEAYEDRVTGHEYR